MGASRPQKTLARFLAPGATPGKTYLLDPSESHHLLRVRRARPGQELLLLDLEGRELLARLKKPGKEALVEVEKVVREEEPPGPEIVFLLPLLKKDLLSFLVEKAVELGVSRVIPYVSSRTVTRPGKHLREKLAARALQALKQCGRLWPLEITPPLPLKEAVRTQGELKILAYEREKERSLKEALKAERLQESLILATGPEGGFSEEEVALFEEAGFLTVHLGRHVLRAETAALYLMSVANFRYLG